MIRDAGRLLREHLRGAIKKQGAGTFVSLHEALGKLVEEQHEFAMAVHANAQREAIHEALDIAVVALWTVVSFGVGDV